MSNDTVVSLGAPARVSDPLTELLRTGARGLVEAAVSAEFEEYLSAFVQEKLPDGRQRVVRNGHLPERKILTGLGEVDVRVPKARSRSGSPEPFRSSVAPPYVRRCASLDAAIPWLYLYGVSTGQMRQAVAALVGRAGRPWVVGERGQSAQAQLGRGVPSVVPPAARRRLGLSVGGRHLQRTSRRPRAAVCAGGHWRERPRREALLHDDPARTLSAWSQTNRQTGQQDPGAHRRGAPQALAPRHLGGRKVVGAGL